MTPPISGPAPEFPRTQLAAWAEHYASLDYQLMAGVYASAVAAFDRLSSELEEARKAQFTQDDVELLRVAAFQTEKGAEWCPEGWTMDNPTDQMNLANARRTAESYRDLASRIALLVRPAADPD